MLTPQATGALIRATDTLVLRSLFMYYTAVWRLLLASAASSLMPPSYASGTHSKAPTLTVAAVAKRPARTMRAYAGDTYAKGHIILARSLKHDAFTHILRRETVAVGTDRTRFRTPRQGRWRRLDARAETERDPSMHAGGQLAKCLDQNANRKLLSD